VDLWRSSLGTKFGSNSDRVGREVKAVIIDIDFLWEVKNPAFFVHLMRSVGLLRSCGGRGGRGKNVFSLFQT
jgi:hypothetical protein